MCFEVSIGQRGPLPTVEHSVNAGSLGSDVHAIAQVNLVHDLSDQAQGRVIETKGSQHGLERAQASLVRELATFHVEGDLVRFGFDCVANNCRCVNEAPDEPDAGKPINVGMGARDPAAATILSKLCSASVPPRQRVGWRGTA